MQDDTKTTHKAAIIVEMEEVLDPMKKGNTTAHAMKSSVMVLGNNRKALGDSPIVFLTGINAIINSCIKSEGLKITKEKEEEIAKLIEYFYKVILEKKGSCVARQSSEDGISEEDVKEELENSLANKNKDYVDNISEVAKDMSIVCREIPLFGKISQDRPEGKEFIKRFHDITKGKEKEFFNLFLVALATLRQEDNPSYTFIKKVFETTEE